MCDGEGGRLVRSYLGPPAVFSRSREGSVCVVFFNHLHSFPNRVGAVFVTWTAPCPPSPLAAVLVGSPPDTHVQHSGDSGITLRVLPPALLFPSLWTLSQ